MVSREKRNSEKNKIIISSLSTVKWQKRSEAWRCDCKSSIKRRLRQDFTEQSHSTLQLKKEVERVVLFNREQKEEIKEEEHPELSGIIPHPKLHRPLPSLTYHPIIPDFFSTTVIFSRIPSSMNRNQI